MNKKLIYIFVVFMISTLVLSACQSEIGRRIKNTDVDDGELYRTVVCKCGGDKTCIGSGNRAEVDCSCCTKEDKAKK